MGTKTAVAPRRRAKRGRLMQAQRRAHTRAQLLTAAGHVFARRGYHEATLDAIAEEAGLSKGALYYNFSSKEDFFLTLLEDRAAANLGKALDAYAHAGSAASGPAMAAQQMLSGVERDPRWPPLFFEFVAYCARDPELRKRFAERFVRTGKAAIGAIVEQRVADTGIDLPIPRQDVATIMHALFNGILLERIFDPDGAPRKLLMRAVEILEAGLAHAGRSSIE